jgi:quercetin dioxygenase-like cupin family protein
MSNLQFVTKVDLCSLDDGSKPMEVRKLFDGESGTLIEIKLRNHHTLARHKAVEPITVLCLAGKGVFRAGSLLEEEHELIAGSLIVLAGGIEHEIEGQSDVAILVTKFKTH